MLPATLERAFMKSAKFRWLASNAFWLSVPRNSSYRSHTNYVGLAVVCDLLDLALAEVPLHLAAVEPFGLSRQAHDLPPFPLPRISTSNCSGRDMSFSSVSAGVEWNVLGLPSIPRRFARRGFFLPSSVYRGAVRKGSPFALSANCCRARAPSQISAAGSESLRDSVVGGGHCENSTLDRKSPICRRTGIHRRNSQFRFLAVGAFS